MAIGIAFRAFFAALMDRDAAKRVQLALQKTTTPAISAAPAPKPEPKQAARSEALTLLGTLQREARLLDLIHEPLDRFDDAQIGSAAREVMRDCRKTLDRMFAIEPLSDSEEGQSLTLVGDESPNRARISGSGSAVSGTSTTGTITHRGWQATKCEVPKWNGQEDDAWILAPVEVET